MQYSYMYSSVLHRSGAGDDDDAVQCEVCGQKTGLTLTDSLVAMVTFSWSGSWGDLDLSSVSFRSPPLFKPAVSVWVLRGHEVGCSSLPVSHTHSARDVFDVLKFDDFVAVFMFFCVCVTLVLRVVCSPERSACAPPGEPVAKLSTPTLNLSLYVPLLTCGSAPPLRHLLWLVVLQISADFTVTITLLNTTKSNFCRAQVRWNTSVA